MPAKDFILLGTVAATILAASNLSATAAGKRPGFGARCDGPTALTARMAQFIETSYPFERGKWELAQSLKTVAQPNAECIATQNTLNAADKLCTVIVQCMVDTPFRSNAPLRFHFVYNQIGGQALSIHTDENGRCGVISKSQHAIILEGVDCLPD